MKLIIDYKNNMVNGKKRCNHFHDDTSVRSVYGNFTLTQSEYQFSKAVATIPKATMAGIMDAYYESKSVESF